MTARRVAADGHGDGYGDSDSDSLGNSLDGRTAPVAVHVLTGFLGSGKTTLLNQMIRDPALANSAVVVNEFGDIGVDHLLVSHGQDATLALLGGCLCCELRDGLATTLVDLLARRQRGQCLAFERIIIETTGLADPTPIVNLLVTDARLAELTVIGSVLTVVDAINAHDTLATFAEAVTQVVLADQIVVTKTDLAAGGIAGLERQLRGLNGDATLHRTGVGELSSLSCLLACVPRVPALHHHQSESKLEHTHSHLDAAHIHTFSVVHETPVPGAALTLFVQALAAQLGADLLRVKGFVCIAESPHRPMLLQGAQRVFHPLLQLEAWPEAQHQHTCLVFIVRAPAREPVCAFVQQLFDALIWEATDISARLIQSTPPVGAQPKESVSCLI